MNHMLSMLERCCYNCICRPLAANEFFIYGSSQKKKKKKRIAVNSAFIKLKWLVYSKLVFDISSSHI